MRYYIEQRVWLVGGELTGGLTTQETKVPLDTLLVAGAAAVTRGDRECFSNFDKSDDFDHLRIDFDGTAIEALRQRVKRDGFRLVRMIPRISKHGYLSLTSVFEIEDSVPLEDVEARGVDLALQIDGQFELFDGIYKQLEQKGVLEFPHHYRFGVPEGLEGSSHTPLYALSFNQHVLLPRADQLEASAPEMGLDSTNALAIAGFRAVSGWSVYLWAPDQSEPTEGILDRFTRLVTLDNVLAVQLSVLACGLSATTAFLGKISSDDPRISAWTVRGACLVHRRIEQKMKLRERELLESKHQKGYVRAQFDRSDYDDLRGAYDRAETSLLSAAEGMEAARQQEISAWTNVILCLAAVLGALTVFTAAVDFAYLMPMEHPPLDPWIRRAWLVGMALFLIAIGAYASRLILLASQQRGRKRRA